ncbi:MAG: GNAT family N-acetyltransferase [Spirochaetales bacterium]|nr:GNAT family N-acetyltransferase [Spirochaetales bacterium]
MVETERLDLLTPSLDLAPLALDYYLRNKDFLRPWSPLPTENFYTLEHHQKMMNAGMDHLRNQEEIKLWMRCRGEEELIGQFCFSQIVRGPFQSCYLGYSLDEKRTGRGYMTEALKEGISMIFDDMELHRIEANIMPRNTASLRVTEKLGFRSEGTARDYLKINGRWEDHIHMVLLNPAV